MYYGIMLQDDVTESCYGIVIRDNITELYYGTILWYNITESCYGIILRITYSSAWMLTETAKGVELLKLSEIGLR